MPHVSVMMGGRHYRLACEEGQEGQLEALALYVDGKMDMLRGQFAQMDDQRLCTMAALMIADELHETRAKLEALQAEHSLTPPHAANDALEITDRVSDAVNALADRLETLGARLAGETLR
jgi:cell division protein ZapA